MFYKKNYRGTIELLIEHNANVNIPDIWGLSPLMRVFWNGSYNDNSDIIKLLLNAGADINYQNKDGNTALMLAIKKTDTKSTYTLLEYGADIDIKNKEGKTALDFAVYFREKFIDMFKMAKVIRKAKIEESTKKRKN